MKRHILGPLVPDLGLFLHTRDERDCGTQLHVLRFSLRALYWSFNLLELSPETERISVLLVKFGNVSTVSVAEIRF